MHVWICVLAVAGSMQQAAGQAPATMLPVNTPVEIELLEPLCSETLHPGQEIAFKIVVPVTVDGNTVIPAGTPIQGEVKALQRAGAFRKAAALDLGFKPLRLDNGSVVQLSFPRRPKPQNSAKEKTATGVLAAPLMLYYFPLMPFAIAENAKKGARFTIRAGERYRVYVVNPESTTPEPAATTAPAQQGP